jgi:hypothetical protein
MIESTRDDLQTLMAEHSGPCVSLFMPTHRSGPETQQGPIRWKNLLKRAEDGLRKEGLRSREAGKFLEPAQALLADGAFWQYQLDGLAAYLSRDMARYFHLPYKFDELVVVTERFHIKPLLPLMGDTKGYYILALSQNEVRLMYGSRRGVSEVMLDGIPDSLKEALKPDDSERKLQFHTRTPSGKKSRSAIFHGHGGGGEEAKDKILRYFRLIDRGLSGYLKDKRAPLVLAGVDYLIPIYREANTYPHVVGEGITGNPERLTPEDLRRKAWSIVQPIFRQAQLDAIAEYERLSGTGRASRRVADVVRAAAQKRVETLFVALSRQRWGTYDPDTGNVNLHKEPEPGDEDLLDFAAVQTVTNGGTVFAVKAAEMPDAATLAAILRY